jgi:hypothetical protein
LTTVFYSCRGCNAAQALARYRANPDRTLYYHRLRDISRRTRSRADQIFDTIRRRIAIATLVAATPGMSWRKRANLIGYVADSKLARAYRAQCAGAVRDYDAIDLAREEYHR